MLPTDARHRHALNEGLLRESASDRGLRHTQKCSKEVQQPATRACVAS